MTADPMHAVALGLAVFPLPPGAKAPAPSGWQRAATADPARIRATWPTGANVGVGCWRSNVVVLDLDVPGAGHRTNVAGADSLVAACDAHGQPWPDTLTVATPSGGRHLYYAAPKGVMIGSTSGGKTALGEGIDTRGPGAGGRGGYSVGPGSIVDGRAYEIERNRPMAVLPDWITALLAPSAAGARTDRRAAGRRAAHCRCDNKAQDGTQGAACSRPVTAEDLRCDVCRIGCHPLPRSQRPTTQHRACFSALADHPNANR
ncbi:bifunctional DNA primase/polymerase [Actinomadura coerulea]|uniref:bifunctional DNA primase/polymerase n=1 Tax=Actinomadura coerulea TaxID=46159 RepID=UPI0034365B7E